MKNITLLTLAAALSCGVSAQEFQQGRELKTTSAKSLVTSVLPTSRTFATNVQKNNAPRFLGIRKVKENIPTDKGTVIDVIKEDFSKFTTGEYGKPDYNTDTKKENFDYPWINQDDSYYATPGWGGDNMYPANGCIYLVADDVSFQAHINTPMLDLSNHERVAIIKFKARTDKGIIIDSGVIEAAETYNMGPSWDVLGGILIPEITDEWQTYEAMFYGADKYTLFNIVASVGGTEYDPIPGSFYVDDISVHQIDTYIDMPKTYSHTNYTGGSFVANWEAVEGADHYLLNVYDYSLGYNNPHYIITDQKVSETSYKVEGTESGLDYYYTVTAVDKDGHASFATPAVEVADLEAPVLNAPSAITEGKYSASWNEIPYADRYNYMASVKRVAEKDGEFIVTSENFTGICDAEGNPTGWTKEDPQSSTYDQLYLSGLNQGGWVGTQYAPYTDYICLDGWQYVYNKADASLQSPVLDLSKDNGKVKLSVKLCGTKFDLSGFVDENNNPLSGWKVVDAAAAMFNYDEKTNSYVQTELYYNRNLTEDWQTCEFNFTTGSEHSTVGIFCVQPENLYVDDVIIAQNYKAGEELMDPFFYQRFASDPEIEVTLPIRTLNKEIYHKANAVKTASQMSKEPGKIIESKYSDMGFVGNATTTGIEAAVTSQNIIVRLEGNTIVVTNQDKQDVNLLSTDGKLIYADQSGAEEVRIPAPESGVYIVKVGNHSVKLGF